MTNHSPLKNFWAKIIEEFNFSRVSAALSTISPDRKHSLLSLSKFKEDLLDAVVFISSSCLHDEYSRFLLASGIDGNIDFNTFSRSYTYKHVIESFPELARIVDIRINSAINCVEEALYYLGSDKAIITQKLGIKAIDSISFRAFLSDPHNHGRQVIKFTINDDICIFYKPKSLWTDQYFESLMNTTLEHLSLPFNTQSNVLISNNNYSWMTELCECNELSPNIKAEISGVLLYLSYFTRTTDLIQDNVIGTRFGLRAIDTEFLFSPKLVEKCQEQANYFLDSVSALESSSIDTALLPRWLFTGSEIKDVSGFCGHLFSDSQEIKELSILPTGILAWDVRYEAANTPNQEAVHQFHDTSPSIIDGFRRSSLIYEFITAAHLKLLTTIPTKKRVTRFTFRPTMAYTSIMRGSFNHQYCLSKNDRINFIIQTLEESGSINSKIKMLKPADREKVYKEELTALSQLDIPIFKFDQITNQLHLPLSNETIDLSDLNHNFKCTPKKSLAHNLDIVSQENAILFSLEAFFEKFLSLPNWPALELFNGIGNKTLNSNIWNHILNKCCIYSQRDYQNTNQFSKHLLQPSFVQGCVQVGVPGPGLWNGLVGILMAGYYQNSKLISDFNIFTLIKSQSPKQFECEEILSDISQQFGFGNSSGIACLTLLEKLNHESDSKDHYSQMKAFCCDLIHEEMEDYLDADSKNALSFHGELDLYDGLLGTISSVAAFSDGFKSNILISKLLEQWSLKLSESILDINSLCVDTSYSELSKCLRNLSLAHGHIGTAIAFQRIGATGNQIDTLMNLLFEALELFFNRLPLVKSASNSIIANQQSLIANCNGLGGIALGLTRIKSDKAASLITACSQTIFNSLAIIQNQLTSQPSGQRTTLGLHCDSPLTNMQSIKPLDHSLCCGVSGTLTTLFEINRLFQLEPGSQKLIDSHAIFLIKLLNSYKKDVTEGRPVIPHRRDLSLFKGLGGVFLALDQKYQLCAKLATLEIYSEHETL